MVAEAKLCSYLPEELWEYIIKFHDGDDATLMSLSVVSKQFLSITNRVRSTVTITNQTIPFLPCLFYRFPNITSLNLQSFSNIAGLDALLCIIPTLLLDIKSLNISKTDNILASKLRALSKKMKNLRSLTCSNIYFVDVSELFFIADCFPLLEELNLNFRTIYPAYNTVFNNYHQFLPLPKLRKINLFGDEMSYKLFSSLWERHFTIDL
ncbi:unnamed protein product [Trifolium pratense]|uniref:Uncharacterized protein n=1 Tax=Trifolium pratense TaxID=57577 RepID=A0ACB0KKD5_TRIPR|nr:unnamed protein product [Trifolium pratense]